MSSWTPERRKRQADLIQRWRPWKQSTGPRSANGKARAARNAYKGAGRNNLRRLGRLLREYDRALQTTYAPNSHDC